MRRALLAVLVASLVSSAPLRASAQSIARPSTTSGPEATFGRFGVGAAIRGLESDDPRERLRSVERLGALGSSEAVAALVDALEPGLLRGEVRLAAVRALAPHAADDDARAALVREVLQAGVSRREGPRTGLEPTRSVAALALARSGNERALAALGAAVAQGGAAGVAARDALLAVPPARLEVVLGRGGRGKPGARSAARIDGRVVAPPLLALLGDLGDARALPVLRGALGASAPAARIEAALALARLGDEAALSFARAGGAESAATRVAAAEVRARLGDPGAPAAITALLRDAPTRDDGLRLARLAPDGALVPAVAAIARGSSADHAAEAIGVLGQCGGPQAVAALVERARTPGPLALAAAVALGRAPGAGDAIARELTTGDGRPGTALVVAGIVRALALGDRVEGLDDALQRHGAAGAPGGAELAVFGRVALGMIDVDDALAARPRAVSEGRWWGAIARGALVAGAGARARLGERWLARGEADVGSTTSDRAVAASVALLDPAIAARFTTSYLLATTLEGGPATPLAARELARRDDGTLRAHVDRLADGVDPVVRAHVAAGLGGSADPSATSRLAAMLLGDDDAGVRAAAVRALSRRGEPQRRRPLELAWSLDPDGAVRALARAARSGRVLADPGPEGGDVGVTTIVVDGAPSASAWTARVRRPDGLALPVVVPTDGVLVVPGLGAGESAILLASPPG